MVLGPVFRPIIENCWQQKFVFLKNMSLAFFDIYCQVASFKSVSYLKGLDL
jgi:hypothetical protein